MQLALTNQNEHALFSTNQEQDQTHCQRAVSRAWQDLHVLPLGSGYMILSSSLDWIILLFSLFFFANPAKLSLLILFAGVYKYIFKTILLTFQTAKVSLDFKKPFATLNDKWINSERELWHLKQAENKWRVTCLNCKSKNWNVLMIFEQFANYH